MKWLYEELKKQQVESRLIWSADDYDPIVNELRKSTADNSVVLLKGSRGMALERIIEVFSNGGNA